ncbi:MAG: mercuric reductase [Candidatus Doudnabacteria bacterium]|nr:mercuric reductase [Candidatus Doudnabacteria bacterium]
MKKFDAIIIGTGQAGVPLAKALAEQGWKLAVLEHGFLGGSCVNYGCTPTKAMVATARRAYVAADSSAHGLMTRLDKVDLPKIVARKDQIVQSFRGSVERKLSHENITLYRTTGKFVGTYLIQAGDEVIEGKRIFLNTGQSPLIPDTPGLAEVPYLTSTEILDLKELPRHLLVMGGGYVGLEFAQMFRRFGSKVTVVQRGGMLAKTEDPDIEQELRKVLESEGVKILLNSDTKKVGKKGGDVVLTLDSEGKSKIISGSHLLVATGRKPNTEELNLGKAGIDHDKRGYIKVNEKLETNVPNIYGLGDIRGGPAFTHTSYNDYEIVYRNLVLGENVTMNDRVLVYAMFIDPSLGRAGLTEREAKEQGYDYVVAEYPMEWVARAIELGETSGKMKMIIDKKTERILGAAILGYEGAELIQVVAAYMNAGASYKVVQRAITIHPTLAEGIQSLALQIKP